MVKSQISEWKKLPIGLAELCLDTTLRCGQSFRWKKLENEEWSMALHGRILSLKQDSSHLHYRVQWPQGTIQSTARSDDTKVLIENYLNLRPNLADKYEQWSQADANFKKRAPKFTGVRILRQDSWEALIGFICSSNNNIARISQMVANLCLHYGPLVGHIGTEPFHDFPTPQALAVPGVESRLRELGFGYRAKYLATTAQIVANEKPQGWLDTLCCSDLDEKTDFKEVIVGGREGYRQAHEELLQLQGVGPKVADCVCLMGLGWTEAIPVDTHVWQIAQRDYKFGKGKHRSLTKATYDAIGDHFRELWGLEAGWAHSVLFAADLRTFAIRVVPKTEIDTEETVVKSEAGEVLTESKVNVKRALVEELVKDEPLDEDAITALEVEGVKDFKPKRKSRKR